VVGFIRVINKKLLRSQKIICYCLSLILDSSFYGSADESEKTELFEGFSQSSGE